MELVVFHKYFPLDIYGCKHIYRSPLFRNKLIARMLRDVSDNLLFNLAYKMFGFIYHFHHYKYKNKDTTSIFYKVMIFVQESGIKLEILFGYRFTIHPFLHFWSFTVRSNNTLTVHRIYSDRTPFNNFADRSAIEDMSCKLV